ncbi:MAG: hypothetical protein AAB368_02470, partial [bacterium]
MKYSVMPRERSSPRVFGRRLRRRAFTAALTAGLVLGLVAWLALPSASWLGRSGAGRLVAGAAELSQQARFVEALGELDRAVAADSSHAEAHFMRGVVLNRLGRRAEAAEELEAAVSLEPARV